MASNSIVWTPEIGRFIAVLTDWCERSYSGGYVYGMQRAGKSHAVMYACETLHDFIPDAVVVAASASPGSRGIGTFSESLFLTSGLLRAGHPAVSGRDPVLRARFINIARQKAKERGSRKIIFIVDEAQLLQPTGAYVIMGITNEWEADGISPCVILVGQSGLAAVPREYRTQEYYNILGRFFLRCHHFQGIAEDELLQVLDSLQQPDESGSPATSFIGHSVPDFAKQCLSLSASSETLLEAIKTVKANAGIKVTIAIPMQFVVSAAIQVARHLVASNEHCATEEHWLLAMEDAGLAGEMLKPYL